MLRGVTKERSKNTAPALQASILKCIQETCWWDPVGGHCPSAKKRRWKRDRLQRKNLETLSRYVGIVLGKLKLTEI